MSNGFVTAAHPAHAAILTRPAPRMVETWLIAGTPWWKTYPCACRLGAPCDTTNPDVFKRCRCFGRTDVERFDHLAPHCCAARAQRLSRKDTPA